MFQIYSHILEDQSCFKSYAILKYVELFFSCICFRDLVTSRKANPVLKVSDPTLPVSLEKLLGAKANSFSWQQSSGKYWSNETIKVLKCQNLCNLSKIIKKSPKCPKYLKGSKVENFKAIFFCDTPYNHLNNHKRFCKIDTESFRGDSVKMILYVICGIFCFFLNQQYIKQDKKTMCLNFTFSSLTIMFIKRWTWTSFQT